VFGERPEFRARAGPGNFGTGEEHRSACLVQQVENLVDRGLGRRRSVVGGAHTLLGTVRQVEAFGQHVPGNVDEHGPARRGQRRADGPAEDAGDQRGSGHPVRPLGDGGGDGHLVQAGLQGVGLVVRERAGRGEVEHRRAVQAGVGHRGHHVGEPAPRGEQRDAQGVADPRVTLGRVARVHLVTRVDDGQVPIEGSLVDAVDVGPVDTEHHIDARGLQNADDGLAPADVGHADSLLPGVDIRHRSPRRRRSARGRSRSSPRARRARRRPRRSRGVRRLARAESAPLPRRRRGVRVPPGVGASGCG
jgi:hypothetical protein